MAITEDYIPHTDDKLNLWVQNYEQKIPVYATVLGLAQQEVDDTKKECDDMVASILGVAVAKQTMLNTVKAKDELRKITVKSIREQAGKIKTNSAYTTAMGKDLGILGTDGSFDPAAAKPTLSISMNGGQVVIGFNKQQSNGVKLYCKRGSETAFSFLALDTHAPYHDTRENMVPGQPEMRQYYAYYVSIDDTQFGQQSDTAGITL